MNNESSLTEFLCHLWFLVSDEDGYLDAELYERARRWLDSVQPELSKQEGGEQ
jgi:hypothetical protein